MSRPPGQLPALQRAKGKDGARIGSFFLWHRDPATRKYSRINLATKDEAKAKRRRTEAIGGRRDFLYDDDEPARAAPEPAPAIPIIPASHRLTPIEGSTWEPVVLPPEPAPLAQGPAEPAPSIAPETPTDAGDWTRDATRAAGGVDETPQSTAAPEPETKTETTATPSPAPVDDGAVRVKDIAILKTVFVSASRIVVQLQIALHVLVARHLFKMELEPIRDDMPKDIVGFMEAQGKPWPDTDPREPGRAMWEQFGRRICPDDLVVPDWVLAPALVALGTLPTQVAGAKPVVKTRPHVPVLMATPTPPPTTAPAPTAPPAPAPAPAPPTNNMHAPEPAEPRRSQHVPVMPDMS